MRQSSGDWEYFRLPGFRQSVDQLRAIRSECRSDSSRSHNVSLLVVIDFQAVRLATDCQRKDHFGESRPEMLQIGQPKPTGF
jgi:hypothetical protein